MGNNQAKHIDLHMHSNVSDGMFSPEDLIKISKQAGLAAISLTDHDTLEGLADASRAAAEYGIEFVPGVEISVTEDKREIHILGYYPQKLKTLQDALQSILGERFKRLEETIHKLKALGMKISEDDLHTELGKAAPGRLHVARLLVKWKYAQNIDQAFRLYLKENAPAYVEKKTLSLAETINLLDEAGAISVIAHPGKSEKTIIEKLLSLGLKGIEVYHPDHNKAQIKDYLDLACEKALIITGGSDFHGESRDIINYPKKYSIPYYYLAQLKKQANREESTPFSHS